MIQNKICIYNNKIFLTQGNYLIAYAYEKHLISQCGVFRECFKFKFPLKSDDVNDIVFEVIDNYETGLKSLLIIVFDQNGLNDAFIFCNAFTRKIYRIALPEWAVAVGDYSVNMFVSDGPTFLAHVDHAFHLYSVFCGSNNSFQDVLLCFDSKEHKILQFQCFGYFFHGSSQHLLSLLVISCDYLSEQTIKMIGFFSEKNNPITRYIHLYLPFFFPLYYESVLKAIQVIKCIPHFKANSLDIVNVEWIESLSVICTKDDCLLFTNGVLTYCCRLTLPLMNVMCIKAHFSSALLEDRNLVLAFENLIVFFISVRKSLNCECIKHWSDIEVAITGDILKKGTKQVLLIKQTDIDSWQKACILHCMSSFVPVEFSCKNMMPDTCLNFTVTGFEKKIKVGKASIKEAEHENIQKSLATVDAFMKFNKSKAKAENLKCSFIFQESLVDLILSKDENKPECMLDKYEHCVKLLGEEQKLIDNYCTVRLHFINNGERSICNPTIKVLTASSEAECIQKLFIYSQDANFSRQIDSNMEFNIVLCFLFLFSHEDEDISMILTWYDGSEEEFNNEIFIPEEKKVLIQHQLCIHSKISLTDALNCKIKRDISSFNDLLFARASQQKIKLLVSSLHSSISRFESMLMKSDHDFVDLHLHEECSEKCMVFNSEKSNLFGTHLLFKKCRQNVAEIEAFISNEKKICLLIHYLYQHLPDDVTISSCLKFKDELSQLKKSLVVLMKNETDLLISSLNIHNLKEEAWKNFPNFISLQNAGTLCISKATYQRIRKVLVKTECISDTIFKYIS